MLKFGTGGRLLCGTVFWLGGGLLEGNRNDWSGGRDEWGVIDELVGSCEPQASSGGNWGRSEPAQMVESVCKVRREESSVRAPGRLDSMKPPPASSWQNWGEEKNV